MMIAKNEAELNKMGIGIDPNDPTKAEVLAAKPDETPDSSWSLDRLAAYISGKLGESKGFEIQATVLSRKSALAVFRAGRALVIARQKTKEQKVKWTVWLKERNIPRTNAFEAMELFDGAVYRGTIAKFGLTEAKKKFCSPKSKRKKDTPAETPERTSLKPPASSNRRNARQDDDEQQPKQASRHSGEGQAPGKRDDRVPNTPPPPPKENPDLPLAVLVKVREPAGLP